MSWVPETSRGVLASSVAGGNGLASATSMLASRGGNRSRESWPAFVFQHDLRVQIALVLRDDGADVAAGVLFEADGFALDDVLVADLPADFRQDRDAVRVPLAEDGAGLNFLVLVDQEVGAGGDFVLLDFAALGVQDQDFAVAGEHYLLALVVADDLMRVNWTTPAFLARISLSSTARAAVPPMWKVRMVNWVPGSPMLWAADDSYGHALLDHCPGR